MVNVKDPKAVAEYIERKILYTEHDPGFLFIDFDRLSPGTYPVLTYFTKELRKIGFDAVYREGFKHSYDPSPPSIFIKNLFYLPPSKIYNNENLDSWFKYLHLQAMSSKQKIFTPKEPTEDFLKSIGLSKEDTDFETTNIFEGSRSIILVYPVENSDKLKASESSSSQSFKPELNTKPSDSSSNKNEDLSSLPLTLDDKAQNEPRDKPSFDPDKIANLIRSLNKPPKSKLDSKKIIAEFEKHDFGNFQLKIYHDNSKNSQNFIGSGKLTSLFAGSITYNFFQSNKVPTKHKNEVLEYIKKLPSGTNEWGKFPDYTKTQEVKTQKESSPALRYHCGAFLGLTVSKLCEVTNDYMFGKPKTSEKYIIDYIESVLSYATNAFITHGSLFVANFFNPGQNNKDFALITTGVNILWTLSNQMYSDGKETINVTTLIINSFLLGSPDTFQEHAGAIAVINYLLGEEGQCSALAHNIWYH